MAGRYEVADLLGEGVYARAQDVRAALAERGLANDFLPNPEFFWEAGDEALRRRRQAATPGRAVSLWAWMNAARFMARAVEEDNLWLAKLSVQYCDAALDLRRATDEVLFAMTREIQYPLQLDVIRMEQQRRETMRIATRPKFGGKNPRGKYEVADLLGEGTIPRLQDVRAAFLEAGLTDASLPILDAFYRALDTAHDMAGDDPASVLASRAWTYAASYAERAYRSWTVDRNDSRAGPLAQSALDCVAAAKDLRKAPLETLRLLKRNAQSHEEHSLLNAEGERRGINFWDW